MGKDVRLALESSIVTALPTLSPRPRAQVGGKAEEPDLEEEEDGDGGYEIGDDDEKDDDAQGCDPQPSGPRPLNSESALLAQSFIHLNLPPCSGRGVLNDTPALA